MQGLGGAAPSDEVLLLTLRSAVRNARCLQAVERRAYVGHTLFGGSAAAVPPRAARGKDTSAARPKSRRGGAVRKHSGTALPQHPRGPVGVTAALSPRPVSRRGRPNAPPRSDSPLPEPPTDLSDEEAAMPSHTEAVAPLLRCPVDFPDDFTDDASGSGVDDDGDEPMSSIDVEVGLDNAPSTAPRAPAEGNGTYLCSVMKLAEQVHHSHDRRVLLLILEALVAARGGERPAYVHTVPSAASGLPPTGSSTAKRAQVRHLDPTSLSRNGGNSSIGADVASWVAFMGDSPNKGVAQAVPCTLSPASATPTPSSSESSDADVGPGATSPPGTRFTDAESSSVDEGRFVASLAAHLHTPSPAATQPTPIPSASSVPRPPTPPQPSPLYFDSLQIESIIADVKSLLTDKLTAMVPANQGPDADGAKGDMLVEQVEHAVRRFEGLDIGFNKDSVVHSVCSVIRNAGGGPL
eukprot:TRINITY_DN18084_c0_g1_i1.p1 TRINITY_DN18084_c0_g1~~TRINITY_DN18084_c0_g1_i1.p1  ORF type:complete len:465 (+),score=17.67 TRINITY_DN18084_c0_g1_i1:61-1455(+)